MTSENERKLLKRDSGIELLRILLMFLIVIHHLIVHGSDLISVKDLPANFSTYQKLFYEAFVLFPVDCFILISGYYAINLKLKRILSLWFQCCFYSAGIALIFFFYTQNIKITSLILSFFPITFTTWWFITCYFILMLLSPILNFLSEKMTKQMFVFLLVVGLIINCWISFITCNIRVGGDGSTLVNFIFIYFIGRYLKIYGGSYKLSSMKSFTVYLLCAFSTAFFSILSAACFSSEGIWRLYQFNNPIIILEAACILFCFKNLNFHSDYVNKIGSMILAVYCVHDNHLAREWIYANLLIIDSHSKTPSYILYILLFALIIFVISIMIETVREKISNPILSVIYKRNFFHLLESKLAIAKTTIIDKKSMSQ